MYNIYDSGLINEDEFKVFEFAITDGDRASVGHVFVGYDDVITLTKNTDKHHGNTLTSFATLIQPIPPVGGVRGRIIEGFHASSDCEPTDFDLLPEQTQNLFRAIYAGHLDKWGVDEEETIEQSIVRIAEESGA